MLEAHETALSHDAQIFKKEAEVAQKNYQHELVVHAADIKRLESLEKELVDTRAQLSQVKAQASADKQSREMGEASWRDNQQHLMRQVKELESRLENLKNENQSLHNVAESMTALSNKLQQQCI